MSFLMPHRIANNIKYHLLYTVMLLLILFGALPLLATLSSVLFRGSIILNVLAIWILVGAYYALPERVRLDRDNEQMRQFRKEHPDGTYNAKEDYKVLLHTDEYKSDVFSVFMTTVVVVFLVFAAVFLHILTPPAILEALAYNPAVLLLIVPASVMLTLSYAVFHLLFTVDVHKGWDETRLHVANERHMEPQGKK